MSPIHEHPLVTHKIANVNWWWNCRYGECSKLAFNTRIPGFFGGPEFVMARRAKCLRKSYVSIIRKTRDQPECR